MASKKVSIYHGIFGIALLPLLSVVCDYTLIPLIPKSPVEDFHYQPTPVKDSIAGKIRMKIGKYFIYYGDLHNHTELSDGAGTPREAYDYAKTKAGYDFFGLSDHAWCFNDENWELTKLTADSCNIDSEYVTFYGFEWSSGTYGHCTVVGTEDYCTSISPETYTFTDFLKWLSPRDGMAFFNHPNRYSPEEFNYFLDPPSEKFVGMDLFNKGIGFQHHYYNDGLYLDDNQKSYFDEALSRGWRIGAGGSGDNHSGTWGTSDDFRIAVLAPALTRKDITEALLARRFYSTLDKNIALSFTANGHEMGSVVDDCDITFTITAFDGDDEPTTQVLLYNGNHDTVAIWYPATVMTTITHPLRVTKSDYFYVKITQDHGDEPVSVAAGIDEAISSPIWVTCSDTAD